jgi:hypothetical protein
MLYAGATDGIYQVTGVERTNDLETTKVHDAGEVFRIAQFEGIDGLFATADTGLQYSPDGEDWTTLSLPEEEVYAVTASPSGDLLYAGTRPAKVYVAACDSGVPSDAEAWEEVDGFQQLREQTDWGIPRHDGLAQIRSLQTHPAAPDRIVVGIEVGGIYVSDDRGQTWTARTIDGFDAPHTDDIHHIELVDEETMIASTGSGLYRSSDTGRTWERLDTDHYQRYFREAFSHEGRIYAGGAPGSSSSWEEDTDYALFECDDGARLEQVSSPTPEEVAVGWCVGDGTVMTGTHQGTLLRRNPSGWESVGRILPSESTPVRYLPLSWVTPQ